MTTYEMYCKSLKAVLIALLSIAMALLSTQLTAFAATSNDEAIDYEDSYCSNCIDYEEDGYSDCIDYEEDGFSDSDGSESDDCYYCFYGDEDFEHVVKDDLVFSDCEMAADIIAPPPTGSANPSELIVGKGEVQQSGSAIAGTPSPDPTSPQTGEDINFTFIFSVTLLSGGIILRLIHEIKSK